MKKHLLNIFVTTLAMVFFLSGCAENHYYHRYHHHSPEYYEHRHQAPPADIDINIHR